MVEFSDSYKHQRISETDKEEHEEILCPYGDTDHKNLKEWYESYLDSSADLATLFNDKFNKTTLDENIQNILPRVRASSEYTV